MASGAASAFTGDTPDGSDIEVTDVTPMSSGTERDTRAVVENEDVNTVATHVQKETGFELNDSLSVGLELVTDDPSLNEHTPRIMHLPMKEEGSSLSAHDEGERGPEYSVNHGGAMMAVTVEDGGRRRVAGLLGFTREKTGEVTADGLPRVESKSFIVQDGVAERHRETVDKGVDMAEFKAELNAESGVRVDDTQFTCWGCASVIGIACAGAAYVSYGTCLSAAAASAVFSPAASLAIGAFCTYIVTNATGLSCALGTAAICAGVTNDCSYLE